MPIIKPGHCRKHRKYVGLGHRPRHACEDCWRAWFIQENNRGRTKPQRRLMRKSGGVRSRDPLVTFLYYLMRDSVPPGNAAIIVGDVEADHADEPNCNFTNGYLASYAKSLARRLRKKP